MDTQNLVKQRLSTPDALQRVSGLLSAEPQLSRAELSRRVCREFGFDCRHLQVSSCNVALGALSADRRTALLTLRGGGARWVCRDPEPMPPAADVSERVGLVEGLQLVPVRNLAQSVVWNEVVEHPFGKAILVNPQCGYLVGSSHGWLGVVGFAASVRRLAAHDYWIGWDDKTQERRLHRIIGLNRFRSGIVCRNFASQALSMSRMTMAQDFEGRYNYRPWLVETFVDSAHHSGISFRAANWIHVGATRGRGRQDRKGLTAEPMKEIYTCTSPNRVVGGAEHPAGARVLGQERVGRQAPG